MDQELLAVLMESLKSVKDISLIDQAFLQVGFLRKSGYDIVPFSELKILRNQHQKLEKNINKLMNATNRLFEMETKYQLLFEKQQQRIEELEQQVIQLKVIRN